MATRPLLCLLTVFWLGRVGLAEEKAFENSLGMKMIRIEPGTFTMGSDSGDFDERPVRKVTISRPFFNWMPCPGPVARTFQS